MPGNRRSARCRVLGPSLTRTLDRESSAPEARLCQVLPHQASNTMIIVSFEFGVGNAFRPGGSLGSPGLCRPGPESRQPGRDRENFSRGLLQSCPPPASVAPHVGRDRGRRAAVELRFVQGER